MLAGTVCLLIFIFSTLGVGHAYSTALLWFFALIALQFQVSGFSVLSHSNFYFYICMHILFFFTGCHKTCPLGLLLLLLSATALELIFIYISGRWFKHYTTKVGSGFGLVWSGLAWLGLAWLCCWPGLNAVAVCLPCCLPGCLSANQVGRHITGFCSWLSFRFVFISIYERKN